jgi:predicted transcriptional regulator
MKDKMQLTDSEEIVMKCIWDIGDDMCLSQIMDFTKEYGKDWKSQTVSTFLSKLVLKGFIEPYRKGRYFHYKVLISEKEYKSSKLTRHISFWNKNDIESLANDLCTVLSGDQKALLAQKIKELA